jgi:hypothetical protein
VRRVAESTVTADARRAATARELLREVELVDVPLRAAIETARDRVELLGRDRAGDETLPSLLKFLRIVQWRQSPSSRFIASVARCAKSTRTRRPLRSAVVRLVIHL